jgi:hypothetical protein
MMDVIGLNFLVTCNLLKGKKGRRARYFFYADEIQKQKLRAAEYAEEKGEDYLIVRVVEHIFHAPPTADTPDRTGLYFLINKHNLKDNKLSRRQFFTEIEMDRQRKLGKKYAVENQDDFLIVEALVEISATDQAKRRAYKARQKDGQKHTH